MDKVLKRIDEYNRRLTDEWREIKYTAMKESPFRFYRGACHLFAQDFIKLQKPGRKVTAWLCGDLHLENFGSYKGANRLVYFDINDFDESVLGWPGIDLARFITSIIIAARQMKANDTETEKALQAIAGAYTATLMEGKALMLEAGTAQGIFIKYFAGLAQRDSQALIKKRTEKAGSKRILKIDGLHFMLASEDQKSKVHSGLQHLLAHHAHFCHSRIDDVAIRIAGTGSLGLERYAALCYCTKRKKYYLIDIKEARQSCYTGLVAAKQPKFANEAERINTVGNIMQFNPPAYMSSIKMAGKWYIVKELQAVADKLALSSFGSNFALLAGAATEMAVLAAYAHIRSSGHIGADTADGLKKYAGQKWQPGLIDTCYTLAEKNAACYSAFVKR